MLNHPNKFFFGWLTAFTLVVSLAGCQTSTSSNPQKQATSSLPGEGITITPTYALLEELFQTEVVNLGLRELGYTVKQGQELDYASGVLALANGNVDYTAVHWERNQREHFNNSGGDEKLERLGSIVEPVVQGYLIDKATAEEHNITSIERLKKPEIARLFDSDRDGRANLVGCNTGWACATITDHHLDEYGLRETVDHDQGKYIALFADVISRYEQGKPILYYTWSPFWGQEELVPGEDVVWLEVPYSSLPETLGTPEEVETTAMGKNLGFPVDRMVVLANEQFAKQNPVASKFMGLVEIPTEDVSAQNQLMQQGEDTPEEIRTHAREWVENNQEMFEGWLAEAQEEG